ncbi:MAG: nitrilase-related carbon-nitrogen hydrolase, partial [Bacteroidota bacterium]
MTRKKKISGFRIGLVQMSVSKHVDKNLDKAVERIRQAAKKGAQVVCLPELFRSQYFCQQEDAAFFDLAETVPGPTTEVLGKLAKALGVVIVAPVFERRAPGVYHNSAAIIDSNGSLAGFYRKM